MFLPLQTDALLLTLHNKPKSHRPSSPTLQDASVPRAPSSSLSPIDVRTLALRAFRDKIIVPVAQRLEARLLALFGRDGAAAGGKGSGGSGLVVEAAGYQQPRLQQM